MPCRPSDAASFPPDFTPDTDPFRAALAEHNWRRTIVGLPKVSFLELERCEQSFVLGRAQELKTGQPAPAAVVPPLPPAAAVAPSPSWWTRFLVALDRLLTGWGL